MFAVRGIAVSLSVFVMVYCALSVAVFLIWSRVWLHVQVYPVRRAPDLLFGLRIFPLACAAAITAAFTVPSFLLLEPRAIDEPIGAIPLFLGLAGSALGIFGLGNAGVAWLRATRTLSNWTRDSESITTQASVPLVRIGRSLPAMTAAGIVRPKILLSSSAEFLLTANEMKTAVNHELAHVRRRDNLKKLLFRFVAFPGMAQLENAWLEATEMAADDAAVSSTGEALDLAAALIKLSRLSPSAPPIDLTAALVHSPGHVMNARVERLIAWNEARLVPTQRHSPWYAIGASVVTLATFAFTYSHLLLRVHSATEWLVR